MKLKLSHKTKCRFGFHDWSKWAVVAVVYSNIFRKDDIEGVAQTRHCNKCNLHQTKSL